MLRPGKVKGRRGVNAEARAESPIVTIWPKAVRRLDAAAYNASEVGFK